LDRLQTLYLKNDALEKQIDRIREDQSITADSTWKTLSNWNKYPEIKETNK
jgi:hypothetical protein